MSTYVIVEFTVKDPDVYREKYAGNAGIEVRGAAMDVRYSLLNGLPTSTEGERETA